MYVRSIFMCSELDCSHSQRPSSLLICTYLSLYIFVIFNFSALQLQPFVLYAIMIPMQNSDMVNKLRNINMTIALNSNVSCSYLCWMLLNTVYFVRVCSCLSPMFNVNCNSGKIIIVQCQLFILYFCIYFCSSSIQNTVLGICGHVIFTYAIYQPSLMSYVSQSDAQRSTI